MAITKNNTHWVFICGIKSEHKNVDRHLKDIAFSLAVLKGVGVPNTNISIFIDPVDVSIGSDPLNDLLLEHTINAIDDFQAITESKDSLENIVIIVNGHGSVRGIDSDNALKPFNLIENIHRLTHIKLATVVFGQCYAGIYNYVNLQKIVDGDRQVYPKVCFISASHLNSSLSSTMTVNGNLRWIANIFLFHFFNWLYAPYDVDGDGQMTLTDAYKHAASLTSEKLLETKQETTLEIHDAFQALQKVREELSFEQMQTSPDLSKVQKLQIEERAINLSLQDSASVTHVNQDPWILNANASREFIFDLVQE